MAFRCYYGLDFNYRTFMSKEAPKVISLSPVQRVTVSAERLTLPKLVRRRERLSETISRKEKALTAMTSVAIPDLKTALLLARERETLNLLRLFAGAIVNVELRRHVEAHGLSQEEAAPFIKDLKELEQPVERSGIGAKELSAKPEGVEGVTEKPVRQAVRRVAKPKGETKRPKTREKRALGGEGKAVTVEERLFPSLPITPREGAVFVCYYICARHEAIKQLGAEVFPTDITEALFDATKEGLGAVDPKEQGSLLERLRESSKRKIMRLVESFDQGQIKFIPNENLNFLLLYAWFYQDRLRPVIEGEIMAERAIGGDNTVLGLTRQLFLAGPEERRILLARACLDERAAALLQTGINGGEGVTLAVDETRPGAKEKLIVLRGFTLNEVRGVFNQVLKKFEDEGVKFPLEAERAKDLFPELRGSFLLDHKVIMPHKHTDEETHVKVIGKPVKDGLRRKGFHPSGPLTLGREKLLERKEKETMLLDLDSIVWSLIIHGYKEKGQPLTNDEAKVLARIVTSMKLSREAVKASN